MTTRHDPGIKRKYTYDPKCYDLAALFLGDEPALHTGENMDQLAHLIQQTIEDYILVMRKPAEDDRHAQRRAEEDQAQEDREASAEMGEEE